MESILLGENLLYYEGNIALFQKKIIGVIGTRTPSALGLYNASYISSVLSKKGYAVLSGLAKGIDTAVHQASLSSSIAVLPTSLDKPTYPKENSSLRCEIVKAGGLVVSPFKEGSSLYKSSFVIRDRIQAYLSSVLIVVESSVTGGSMHALKWACDHKRTVYVLKDEKRLCSLLHHPYIRFVSVREIENML